jgi:hypothetical protein
MRSFNGGGSTAVSLARVALRCPLEVRLLTRGPYQEEPPVSSLLKFSHDTIDNVRLGCDDIYSVHVPLRGSALLEALNVWACQDGGLAQQWARHTRDVEVEDVIFLDDIVYELLAVLVDYEDLPLLDALAIGAWVRRGVEVGVRTSPRVVERIVLRMTAQCQLAARETIT